MSFAWPCTSADLKEHRNGRCREPEADRNTHMANDDGASSEPQTRPLHPLPLRIMHWTNAVAMIIMIGSGWKIYNDEVLFGWLHFPEWITIGGGPEGALQWHFFAMWILVINGLAYLAYGLGTGRFRRMLLPIRVREVLLEIRKALAPRSPARRPHALQRRAAPPLYRHHCRHHRAGPVRPDHLEAGPVLRAVVSLLRFPGRAARALHRHGRDRRLSSWCMSRWRSSCPRHWSPC